MANEKTEIMLDSIGMVYKDQGGKRFVLGSDAHTSGDIGKGLAEGLAKII